MICFGFLNLATQVPLYWAAQLTGATIASFVLKAILHPLGITNIGTTTPSGSALQSLVTEIVVTFNMMFVTAAVATDAKAVIKRSINLTFLIN